MTIDEFIKLHEYLEEVKEDFEYKHDLVMEPINEKLLDIEYKLSKIIDHLQIEDEFL